MPSPTRAGRLRIPNYTAIEGAPAGDTGKDLILRLEVSRVQRDVTDNSKVLNFAGFNAVTLSYSIIRYTITLNGLIEESPGAHTDHPLSTGVEHDPDWIDMEEAALTFNGQARPGGPVNQVPQLELNYGSNGDVWRIYKGVIQSLELTRREGKTAVDFALMFGVTWSDTGNPGIREWAA